MIEVSGLTKTYGAKRAVDDISFTVQPGRVTGFLGPNGAGKSTTMRMILGLERPTAGTALVEGKPYRALASPLTTVGSLLEAKSVHPRRSGVNHLRAMAATHGIPTSRVDEVIDITGLSSAAKKKVGGYSLGMGQRLGIASAILGDPSVVILDEPVNGLDPEGVIWVRQMARFLASEGKTVFLSSHLMSEMAQTADHLIVIGQGKILADQPLEEFLNQAGDERVLVRTDEADAFAGVLQREGLRVEPHDGGLMVHGSGRQVAERALAEGILVHELSPQHASLEQVYMAMTQDSVEYRSADPAGGREQRPAVGPDAAPSANPAASAPASGSASAAPAAPAAAGDQGAHAADAPLDAPAGTGSAPAAQVTGDADYSPAHSSQHTPWNQEEK